MPARSVSININNLTDFAFTKIEEGLDHGAWTNDNPPPQKIAPHTRIYFEGESDGIMTGTEGHVKYRIEDGLNSDFYFHWDNPYSSNVIGNHYNIFHEFTNEKYAIWHTGNDNDQNEGIELYIDVSKDVIVPGFLPSASGFKFPNKWNDFGYAIPALNDIPIIGDLKFGDASNGLCGGMVFAVRDYFEARYPIPQTTIVPNNADDPLTKYIIDRLLASLDLDDVTMYIKLMNPVYADTDENLFNQLGEEGRAYVTIKEEFPMIKNDIDNGHPCPIGLIRIKSLSPGDLGHNHQVMVYGYRITGSNVILRIYDPNYPSDDSITMNLSLASTGEPVHADYSVQDGKPIYALFRTNYENRDGFPRFFPATTKNAFAINRSSEQVDIYWVGNDNKIYAAWNALGQAWDDHVYQIPGDYPPPTQGTTISCISRSLTQIDIYWPGSDGRIYAAWNALGQGWNNQVYQIPGDYPPPALNTNIACISRTPVQIDIYWIGNDGKIYAAWNILGETWDGHAYQIPGDYPPPALGSGITVISRTNVNVDLYWIGNDGRIYAAWNVLGEGWDGHVYQIPGDYPSPAIGTSISSISRSDSQVDIYWPGSDGRIYAAWNLLGQTWDNHVYQIPGNYATTALQASISCISRSLNQIDIYWPGSDGRIYAAWNALGETWDGHVYQIPRNYAPPALGTSVNCISRAPDQIDIYWIGDDGKIYAAWNLLGQTWDNHVYQIPGNYTART